MPGGKGRWAAWAAWAALAAARLTKVRRCGQRGSEAGQRLVSMQVGLAGARPPVGASGASKKGIRAPGCVGRGHQGTRAEVGRTEGLRVGQGRSWAGEEERCMEQVRAGSRVPPGVGRGGSGAGRPHKPSGHLPPRLTLAPAEAHPWRCTPASRGGGGSFFRNTQTTNGNTRLHCARLLGIFIDDPH